MKTYSIFGAGAAGLYTAWRLLDGQVKGNDKSKQLVKGDILELYDWGKYNFSSKDSGSREPGARVCTWHYNDDKDDSFVELGGMRYSKWNQNPSQEFPDPNNGIAPGHRLVSKVICDLGLDKFSVTFNESINPLYYLRTKNMLLNDINSANPAPYNVDHYGADTSPNQGFSILENLAGNKINVNTTREQWCEFYNKGKIDVELPKSSIFKKGDYLKDIGYWNLMYDQLGSEGYDYTADGNGYGSNVINWNSAVAFNANNEFIPGNQYDTLTKGYSYMFTTLFKKIVSLAKKKGIIFNYHPDTRLHSIIHKNKEIHYSFANRDNPWKPAGNKTTNAAWLAMPRFAIDLVAQASRYNTSEGLDVLNHEKVQLYLESVVMQPSYKVGMFFDYPWWNAQSSSPAVWEITDKVIKKLKENNFPKKYLDKICKDSIIMKKSFELKDSFIKVVEQSIGSKLTDIEKKQLIDEAQKPIYSPATYQPQLSAWEITDSVIELLKKTNFSEKYLSKISKDEDIMNLSFTPATSFISAIEQCIEMNLTFKEENLLLRVALNNTIGPSITDTPIRMAVYFGNNALDQNKKPVYGILASYDDEQFTSFWEELELEPNQERKIPMSDRVQPLEGPKRVPKRMVKMLRKQLAEMHYGPNSDYSSIPEPLEAKYMDWSLPPFNAGYHAWAAHYDIGDVQRKIRKPSQLIEGADVDIFIVGETYSNDQAWVEGAYCTAESVLNDFFSIEPIIDNKNYPFICP